MERENAVRYLERKGKLLDEPMTKAQVKEHNEKEIEKVMTEGKIYGDPVAEIRWR